MTFEEMRARLTQPSAERIKIIKDEIAATVMQIMRLEDGEATPHRIADEHIVLDGLIAELSRCQKALGQV